MEQQTSTQMKTSNSPGELTEFIANNPTKGLQVIVFHHNDVDGAFAAASSFGYLKSLTDSYSTEHPEFFSVNYGSFVDSEILDRIKDGAIVFVVDFSFERELSDAINKKAGFFRTLDHHITGMENLEGTTYGYYDLSSSGAKMAFTYFNPDREIPFSVTLADNRDLWKKDTGLEDQFHEAIMEKRSHFKKDNQGFIETLARELLVPVQVDTSVFPNVVTGQSVLKTLIDDGIAMVRKRDSNIASVTSDKNLVFTKIGGHDAVLVNYGVDQSDACEVLYRDERYKHLIAGAFSIRGSKMVFSLRKNPELNLNLAKIAENNYGGGGHAAAAGFAVDLARGLRILSGKEKWAMCWRAADVDAILDRTKSVAEAFPELNALEPLIRSRDTCETDKSLLQVLPYIVIHDDSTNAIFSYRRPTTGGEKRLFGQLSIGVGGHIDTLPSPGKSIWRHIAEEASRELEEEVGLLDSEFNVIETLEELGRNGNFEIIRSVDDDTALVHLAIVFHLRVPTSAALSKINFDELTNPLWMQREDLTRIIQRGNLNRVEGWTEIIIAGMEE